MGEPAPSWLYRWAPKVPACHPDPEIVEFPIKVRCSCGRTRYLKVVKMSKDSRGLLDVRTKWVEAKRG